MILIKKTKQKEVMTVLVNGTQEVDTAIAKLILVLN